MRKLFRGNTYPLLQRTDLIKNSFLSQTPRGHWSIALMIWRATKLPSCEQQVNILSFSLAISQTIVFHSCFGDCVFLLSAFWKHGCERRPFWGISVPCVTHSVDKSYVRFTTNPLRGGIQISSANRQSSVSWNFNRMSKTETHENKMDTIQLYHMLEKEPAALRDYTNNDCAGHYNRNHLLSIIVQLRYSGGPLTSLLGGLSNDLRDKHSVQRIVYRLQ